MHIQVDHTELKSEVQAEIGSLMGVQMSTSIKLRGC
jgi:hypothetical protein